MKLPAVAIAAAFAVGIAIGLSPAIAAHLSSRELVVSLFILAALALIAAAILVLRNWLLPAGFVAMACWVSLGAVGMLLSEQPAAPSYVISVVQNRDIDLHSPLRWHGTLRDEPAKLPWGYGYEVELSGVDYEENFLPVSGGLRLSYSPKRMLMETRVQLQTCTWETRLRLRPPLGVQTFFVMREHSIDARF